MKKNIKSNNAIIKKCCTLALAMSMVLSLFSNFQTGFIKAAEPQFGNYYMSDYDSKEEAKAAGESLNEQIYGEGVTLLKNEDNALPLSESAKISLFGKSSANVIHGSSGGGGGSKGTVVSLQQGLTAVGLQLNPTLINFYSDNTISGTGRGVAPTNGQHTSGYNTGETPINMYTEAVESSYLEYSDAAIVIFSRITGEGFDLPRTMTWDGNSYRAWSNNQIVPGARSGTDHYLQLDANEAALLKYCGDNFNKVIVLLNTGSQFECGFLDDPMHYGYHENIKAAMWIGYPGGSGFNALGKVLKGEINPSGKTVDTYSRDFKKDPTWQNFGDNRILKGNQYTNLPSTSGNGGGGYRNNYVFYKEGIYVGYRYYETRGLTEGDVAYTGNINGTANTQWDNWYQAHVVYPLGHGLSYTAFSKTIISQTPAASTALSVDDTISVTVRVTNTGSVAGKEVVQLYYTAPYITGEIEKAHVVLGAFEKTQILAPNASEDITLTLKVRDMASYDFSDANSNGFKGYELDAGNYSIRIMNNAHTEVDSVEYTIASDIQCLTDGTTGNSVVNQFDDVSSEITTYLSRADFEGTFPTTVLNIAASQELIDKMAEWLDNTPSDADQPYYSDTVPTTGDNTGAIKLTDLIGLDYSDPLWNDFLNQLSVNTLQQLAGRGSYASGIDLPELELQRVVNADGASGWINWTNGTFGTYYAFYSCQTVLASTWNKELAYEKGVKLGNEGLFGNGTAYSKFPGYYCPAINTHRSPFGGRNSEYFSEDSYISGIMAAGTVAGAKEKGLFTYVKHFGVNDQETNRCGLVTWASEQSMREIYLRSFEITVKEGQTTAIMSALNRIGPVWAGGSYELLTEILRNEWGFNGTVVTDSYVGGLSNADQMIRAGGNLALGNGTPNYNIESATTITALRNAAHGICYTHANSMAMNTGFSTIPPTMNPYVGALLDMGIFEIPYTANLATATLNELIVENPDNSLIQYNLKEGSTLPEGLVLSADGILSGTPSEEINNHKFIIQATYLDNFVEAEFTISIINPNGSIIYQEEEPLDMAFISTEYNGSVATAEIFKPDATQTEIDNFPPVTYALQNASFLPEGLTLSSDGIISGTPTKECRNYEFVVVASALGYSDQEVTFSISVYNNLTFTSKTLATGKFGVTYIDRINLAESDKEVKYMLKEGSVLPNGLKLTNSGYIVGTPTQVVTDHKFTVLAVADYSVTQEVEYTITIGLTFNEFSLPDGNSGEYYDATVNTAQGSAGITYSLKDGGTLPEGLILSEDGTITGTPKLAGVYTFTIVAEADGYLGDEITLQLYIEGYIPNETGCNSTSNIPLICIVLCLASLTFIRRKTA